MLTSLGFSGTQNGMSIHQKDGVWSILQAFQPREVHHGDCVGSDEEFHNLCIDFVPRPAIHVHPPDNPNRRAFCIEDFIYPEKSYMERNDDIVLYSHALVATPKGTEVRIGSGTWATIRRARKKGIPIYIIYPDGRFEQES